VHDQLALCAVVIGQRHIESNLRFKALNVERFALGLRRYSYDLHCYVYDGVAAFLV